MKTKVNVITTMCSVSVPFSLLDTAQGHVHLD